VVRCPKSVALRFELRQHWFLPDEMQFWYSGPNWLLLLLSSVTTETNAHILFLSWRAWHLQNDVVHVKGLASIKGSVKFLTRYAESLGLIGRATESELNEKGKGKMHQDAGEIKMDTRDQGEAHCGHQSWIALEKGWIKLNTDAAFVMNTGESSAGIIARNAAREVLLSAWRTLPPWNSAEEAEAEACKNAAGDRVYQTTHVCGIRLLEPHTLGKKEVERSGWEGVLYKYIRETHQ
jgi:hypothetical protein